VRASFEGAGNYNGSSATASITIAKANLDVTASSPANILFGASVPVVTPSFGAFAPGDTAGNSVATLPTCGTNYTVSSPLGHYITSCSGGVSHNYDLHYIAGGFEVIDTAPTVALNAANELTVDEGSPSTFSFTITDPDPSEHWGFVTGYPTCGAGAVVGTSSINDATHTGSFQCKFPDGPATTQVKVKVIDVASVVSGEDAQTVTVKNVAPVVTFTGSNVLTGPMVFGLTGSFNGSFTDLGTADSPWVAKFAWDGVAGALTTNQTFLAIGAFAPVKPYFTSVGCAHTGTATVTDKDGGVGTASATVRVGGGAFLPPMTNQPVTDQLKNGQVLPVKVSLTDCNGAPINGLTPKIELRAGDQTDEVIDNAVATLAATSVSAADTTGQMRQSGDGTYIYNMRVNVPTNQLNMPFTVVITPSLGAGYASTITLRHKIIATK
jgi:hypothetical protein